MIVALDSHEAAARLDEILTGTGKRAGVFIDIDVGLHRTGLQTPTRALTWPNLSLRVGICGLMACFAIQGTFGRRWLNKPKPWPKLTGSFSSICLHGAEKGFDARIVSAGSTPTAYQSHLAPSVNEIRPGTYVFNDLNTLHHRRSQLEDCAVRIVATVVSTAVPGRA